MKQIRFVLALVLALALLVPAGCRSETVGPEQPTDSPAATDSQGPDESTGPTESAEPTDSPQVSESQPAESAAPEDEDEVLIVDGQELAAVRYDSPLGYSMAYPEDQITLTTWEDGESYLVDGARGTYLAVSRLSQPNISQAVAFVQFDNMVEDDPTGFIFGSKGYAGVRMVQQSGGLTQEFILVEQDGVILLIQRAIFTGGEEAAPLLQAMLDSFTIR